MAVTVRQVFSPLVGEMACRPEGVSHLQMPRTFWPWRQFNVTLFRPNSEPSGVGTKPCTLFCCAV
jgi:hypothetical protein